jgi:IclR family transcriptional regulator, acetate operon repressor
LNQTVAANERERPTYLIESVDKALRLLHMFLAVDKMRVSEAAEELDVAPSTAHRLLTMLQYHGFVAQDRRTHEYVPGPDLVRFGLAVAKQLDLRQRARPIMEALALAVNETVHLGVPQAGNVLYVSSVESTRVLRIGARTGASIPLHSVSLGKALLAALSGSRFDELYPKRTLHQMTENTIATKSELSKQLAAIRKRGYAYSCGESEDGVASIAMAVLRQDGEPSASLSISAPAMRATPDAIIEWLPHLRSAVADLSALSTTQLPL